MDEVSSSQIPEEDVVLPTIGFQGQRQLHLREPPQPHIQSRMCMGRDVLIGLWLCAQHLKHHSDDHSYSFMKANCIVILASLSCVPSTRGFFYYYYSLFCSLSCQSGSGCSHFTPGTRRAQNRHLELIRSFTLCSERLLWVKLKMRHPNLAKNRVRNNHHQWLFLQF